MVDDIRLVRELGQDTPLPRLAELDGAYARLMAEMAGPAPAAVAAEKATVAGARRVAAPRRRRFALAFGLPGLAAAAVAAVLVLAPLDGGGPEAAHAEAATVLHRAAAAALTVPDVEPRPDQYYYVRTEQAGHESQAWRSMDGQHDGYFTVPGQPAEPVPGCHDGRQQAYDKYGQLEVGVTRECETRPAYRPELPDTADAMFAYINADASTSPRETRANYIAKTAMGLMGQTYLRPKVRAALFEALSRVPGLTIVRDVTDGAGRPGIGIGWNPGSGDQYVLVFHPTTYAYMGMRDFVAVLQVAVVDRAGQQP
ncbi:CU044_5270 family protein [Longispora sp. K20-0274]|uniref:CU044_5270 family protein n=1 Tax=Longispora sp. K20-0274 TaxID=3088255 RepID=UPI00399B34EF